MKNRITSKKVSVKLIWQSFSNRSELFQDSQVNGKVVEEQTKDLGIIQSDKIFRRLCLLFCWSCRLVVGRWEGVWFLSSFLFCSKLRQAVWEEGLPSGQHSWGQFEYEDASLVQDCAVHGPSAKECLLHTDVQNHVAQGGHTFPGALLSVSKYRGESLPKQ